MRVAKHSFAERVIVTARVVRRHVGDKDVLRRERLSKRDEI